MKLLGCNSQCDSVNTGTFVFVKNKSYFTVIMIFWTKKEVIIALFLLIAAVYSFFK